MADNPWTRHPIVFDRAINRKGLGMRLEIDSRSNVLITSQKFGAISFISTDLEGLGDLYSLIEKACGKPDGPTETHETYPTDFDKVAEGDPGLPYIVAKGE